jgi:hypothetical protein
MHDPGRSLGAYLRRFRERGISESACDAVRLVVLQQLSPDIAPSASPSEIGTREAARLTGQSLNTLLQRLKSPAYRRLYGWPIWRGNQWGFVREAVDRDQRYSSWSKFVTPPDFMNDVRAMARALGIDMESTPFRPRRDAEDARALMRELDDPRYWMRDCLVTMVGAQRVGEVRGSEVRVVGDTVEVYCHCRARCAHRSIWHACEERVAAVMRALLADPYAALEAARAAGGPGYHLVADVRWDGEHLQRIRTADDAPDPGDDWLLDPRAWLLLVLGAEGRMGQVRRAMRSNLHIEGTLHSFVLDVPQTERKRAPWLLLAPVQRRAVVFMQTVGYLADLERALEAEKITDYPLFPQGRLVAGRALVGDISVCDEKRLNEWARDVEARLGLERVEGEGMYGWRRCFVDLFAH